MSNYKLISTSYIYRVQTAFQTIVIKPQLDLIYHPYQVINDQETQQIQRSKKKAMYQELQDECYLSGSDLHTVAEDERKKRNLFACIGSLMGKDHLGVSCNGTAFLISADTIVTAAHNLCTPDLRQRQFKFYPGINGSNKSYPFYTPEQINGVYTIYAPSQYLVKKRQNNKLTMGPVNDFAFIKLNQKVEGQSFLSLGINFSDQTARLSVYGYPSVIDTIDPKNYQKVDEKGQQLIITQQGAEGSNRIYKFAKTHSNKVLKYQISTLGGQSGCPVTVRGTGEMQGTDIVVGIHNKGLRDVCNCARFITWDFLIRLKAWSHKYKCEPFKVIDLSVMEQLDMDGLDFAEVQDVTMGSSQWEFSQQLSKKVHRTQQITNSDFMDMKQQKALIQQCNGIQTIIKESSSKFRDYSLVWDPHTSFAQFFSIVGSRVTFNGSQFSDKPYQITSRYPIPLRSVTNFHIVKYGTDKPLIIGFITKNRKYKQYTQQEKGSIPYWTTPKGKSNNSIQEGGRLQMNVDKIAKKIRLINVRKDQTQKNIMEDNLDDFFVRQDLFIFVTMSQQGDSIYVS